MLQKAEVEKTEHDIISLEVLWPLTWNKAPEPHAHAVRHCKDKVIEKGRKDDILMNYGCVPILFVCVPVLHAASHWLCLRDANEEKQVKRTADVLHR